MQNEHLSRRQFLETSSIGGAALALGLSAGAAVSADDEVVWGVIGTGGRARYLLERAMKLPGIRIGAICDLKQEQLDRTMKIVADDKPTVYKAEGPEDFRRMLDKEKLNGVFVATEVGNHAAVAVPVLEAGFNLFCEKPLETTVEKVDRLVSAARKAKGVCQIGLQRRYKPGYIEPIEKIRKGAVGKIRFLECQWKWMWRLTGGWIIDAALSGGELVEQAVHHMDVISWLMDGQHPDRVISMGGVMRDNPSKSVVEDHSSTVYEFANGVKCQYTHLFHLSTPKFCAEVIRVYGETAGAEINKPDYFAPGGRWKAYDKDGNETVLSDGATETSEGAVNELIAFAEHCRKGGTPASNIETARVATLMAIMGRTAMFNAATGKFDERVIDWKDLGTTTDR